VFKLKIALVCTEKLPVPAVVGGAIQLYIDGIIPYLSKPHHVTVFSIEYPGLPARETRGNVQYVRLPAQNVRTYLNSLKTELQAGYDLVYVFNRPLWVLSLSENPPGTRFSLSLHNEMFHPEKITDTEGIECINRVELINTVSRFIADGIAKRFPMAQGKLNVIYSGVDTGIYKPNWSKEGLRNKDILKQKYGLQGYKVVLYVGRLSIKKGAHIVIKALERVMKSHNNVALVIVGSKWYGQNQTDDYTVSLRTAAKNLSGPIVFTGFLPPSEIPKYYNLGDLFVCASQWNEPLARVHYEAMGAGLPIITTNRGGNPEVVGGYGNGLVVDKYNSPDAFADSIQYLLNNPQLAAQMGKAGRKLAEGKFNWARVAEDMLKVFAQNDTQEVSLRKKIELSRTEIKKEIKISPQNTEAGFFWNDF